MYKTINYQPNNIVKRTLKVRQYLFGLKMEHLYKEIDEKNLYCTQHLMQFATLADYEYYKKKNCIKMLSHPMK